MNAGKVQYRVIRRDSSSYISKEYDTLEEVLKEICLEMLKGNIESILINSMAVDKSYLDTINMKFQRFPKQNGLWEDIKKWWSG